MTKYAVYGRTDYLPQVKEEKNMFESLLELFLSLF